MENNSIESLDVRTADDHYVFASEDSFSSDENPLKVEPKRKYIFKAASRVGAGKSIYG